MSRNPTREDLEQRIRVLEEESAIGKQVEKELHTEREKLGERVKELRCLYGLSELIEKPGVSLDGILKGAADLLPPGWQYPDIAQARIVLDGHEYTSQGFEEGKWKQTADIVAHGSKIGAVEIFYLKDMPELNEGPFLKEERNLINAIAERLGRIIEHKWAEEALLQSEAKYRVLTDRMNDVMWTTDMDFNVTYISPSVTKLVGFTPEECIRMAPWEAITPESLTKAVTLLNAELQREQEEGIDPERTVKFEMEDYHKNGSTVWVECVVGAIRDSTGKMIGFQGVSRNISERKHAEDALRQSEAKYRFLTEKMNDIIWTADLELKMSYISPSVEKVLGYTPEERIGHGAGEVMTPESLAWTLDHLGEELKHDQDEGVDPERTVTFEAEYYHKNGSTVWIENVASAIRDVDGKFIGIHGVSRDITERKKTEMELKQYHEKLEDMVYSRTAELTKAYEQLTHENDVRKTTEVELDRRRQELEEMNTALRVILKQREEDKANIEMNVMTNHKVSILPYLDLLEKTSLNADQTTYLSIIRSNLNVITSTFNRKISTECLGLTANELKVASLIREGRTSKEISGLLNVSINTVNTYRRKIRAKTNLKNEDVNLRTYLQSLE